MQLIARDTNDSCQFRAATTKGNEQLFTNPEVGDFATIGTPDGEARLRITSIAGNSFVGHVTEAPKEADIGREVAFEERYVQVIDKLITNL